MDGIEGWPAGDVSHVPYPVYFGTEIYAREQRRIFQGPTWNFLCLEAELPAAGDFRTSFVGDTPVIVTRDQDGVLHAMVNRCVHKGALVCFAERGNASDLTCVYHNWRYDLSGALKSVAFQRGVNNKGGMAGGFDIDSYRLRPLRLDVFHGLVFGTFSDEVPPLADYIGAPMQDNIARIFNRPLSILGTHSQVMNNNWKLYMENTRDSYHASLLHLFHATFGVVRMTWDGGVLMNDNGWNHLSYTKKASIADDGAYEKGGLRSMDRDYSLADTSLLDGWEDFNDGVTNAIQTIFPTLTIQQILNTLAVRQLVPRGPGKCELFWTVFGYADDPPARSRQRVKQGNLIGPAGLISMEDAAVGQMVNTATRGEVKDSTLIEMGGYDVASIDGSRATETSVRGFWRAWRELTGI